MSDLQFDPCPLIREGMMVEVVHGPLKGVVGRLMRKGAHARLVLSVDLIGQAVSVEVDAADVRSAVLMNENRQHRSRAAVCARPDGGHDGYRLPPARQAAGRAAASSSPRW